MIPNHSAEDGIYSSQGTSPSRPWRRGESVPCCTALPASAMGWPTAALQISGNNILISQDCTHRQTLLMFPEESYERSTWAFWGSSDSHNTIIRPEMSSGNRNSCSVLCARCPHHCPDRTLILKLIPQKFHSSSTQMLRSWVNPKHNCQGERCKTKRCQEPKYLKRGWLAPHNPVQARESPAWSHISNPGITQPGNTTDTPCTSSECRSCSAAPSRGILVGIILLSQVSQSFSCHSNSKAGSSTYLPRLKLTSHFLFKQRT